jgi:hypothetical protein
MPDDQPASAQNTSDGDAKNTGAPAAGETQTSKSQTEAASTQADKTFTQADLEKYAAHRSDAVRREEKRKYEQQLKDAQLSEAERATKRIQELEQEIRLRDARETIADAARKANSSNGGAVYKLVRDMLEFDDKTGQVSNLRDVIDYARETAPELFPKRPGSGNGGDGQAGSFSRNMNDLIRRSAGRQ